MSLSFETARSTILEHARPLGKERVSLLEAGGRVLAERIYAPWDLPRLDNSAMDGYAVRSADCAAGKSLRITGYIPAGGKPEPDVAPGCAVRIMTGAPTPPGCNAIVPFEEADEKNGRVLLRGGVGERAHIRYRGEDVTTGTLVMEAGTLLRPPEINLLASFGKGFVSIYRRPRVAILSSGDELVELGETPAPDRIVNSNSLALAAAVREAGAEATLLGIARDNPESLREKLGEGLRADVLMTSAGVSAGDLDLVREVLDALEVRQIFWKINIRPGRPTAFGLHGTTPVFSLPGNPVAAMITFEAFVRPALLSMLGHRQVIKPYFRAVLREGLKKKQGRVQFVRLRVTREGDGLVASSAGDQNTGIMRTMVHANAIGVLPEEAGPFASGESVNVHLLAGLESLEP